MNTFAMILAIILFLMSLLLTLAQPVIGIIGMVVAVLFFLWARKKKKDDAAKKAEAEAQNAAWKKQLAENAAKRAEINATKIPSGKYKKTMTVKLVGVTFDCERAYGWNRQDVLCGSSDNDVVSIEPYTRDGEPAYLVVDPVSGRDIGSLPAEVSEEYPNARIEGYLTGCGSFTPDDKDEEIYYSTVKIYIMEDA